MRNGQNATKRASGFHGRGWFAAQLFVMQYFAFCDALISISSRLCVSYPVRYYLFVTLSQTQPLTYQSSITHFVSRPIARFSLAKNIRTSLSCYIWVLSQAQSHPLPQLHQILFYKTQSTTFHIFKKFNLDYRNHGAPRQLWEQSRVCSYALSNPNCPSKVHTNDLVTEWVSLRL